MCGLETCITTLYLYRTFCWLSFFSSYDSKCNEFVIFKKSEEQKIKYFFLNNPDSFDSLTELVEYYCRFPLKGPKFEQILTTLIPKKVGYALATYCSASVIPFCFSRRQMQCNHGLMMCPERKLRLC